MVEQNIYRRHPRENLGGKFFLLPSQPVQSLVRLPVETLKTRKGQGQQGGRGGLGGHCGHGGHGFEVVL